METSDFEQVPALQVDNRHLQLTLKALLRDCDRAYAQINTSWLDPRPTLTPADEPPHPHLPFYGIF